MSTDSSAGPRSSPKRLLPLPAPGLPIRQLERLWLWTACLYEVFDETVMADADWDHMAKELNDRRPEWSPFFVWSLGGPDKAHNWNVGTTASGVDWSKGVPAMVHTELLKATSKGDLTYRRFIDIIRSHQEGNS